MKVTGSDKPSVCNDTKLITDVLSFRVHVPKGLTVANIRAYFLSATKKV